MQEVELPDGQVIEFPDSYTPDQMKPYISRITSTSGQLPYPGDTWEQRMEAKTAANLAFDRGKRPQRKPDMTYPEAQQRVLEDSWLPSLESGFSQAGLGLMSLGARATGWGDADAINRESSSLGQAADTVAAQDKIPDILQRGVRGVAASLPPMLVGGLAGGGGALGGVGAIALGATMEGNQAYTEGKDRGLEGEDLNAYATMRGVVEGGIAGTFQALGMGGAEAMFKPAVAGIAKQGVKQWLKGFMKETFNELSEENLTELSHMITERALIADDESHITPEKLVSTLGDTTVQTLITMGVMKAGQHVAQKILPDPNAVPPHVAPTTQATQQPPTAQQTPPVTQEPQISEKPPRIEDTNDGPPPSQVPVADQPEIVSDVPQPAAEEYPNVAQDPGEEVIPDAIPEEAVQGGPQGQVVEPVSGPVQEPVAATEPAAVPEQPKRIGKKKETKKDAVDEDAESADLRAQLDAMTWEEVEELWRFHTLSESETSPSKPEMIETLVAQDAELRRPIRMPEIAPKAEAGADAPETGLTAPSPEVALAQPGAPVAQLEPEQAPEPVVAPEAVQEPAAAPKKTIGKPAAKAPPEPTPDAKPLYESKGDDGTVAQVFAVDGGYSVSLYDPDSGERLPSARIYKDLERAKAHADTIEVKEKKTIGKKKPKKVEPVAEIPPVSGEDVAATEGPATAAKSPWHGNREEVFSAMRTLDEEVQREYERARELAPRGGAIAVGSADFDHTLKAGIGEEYLRALNKGSTPDEALDAAKALGREMVQKWNTKGSKGRASINRNSELHRWEGAGESIAENIHRRFVQSAEPAPATAPEAEPVVEKPAEETPPEPPPKKRRIGKQSTPAAATEPVARTSPAKGTEARTKLEADVKAAEEAYNTATDEAAKARANRDKSGYGTKRREQLDRKFDKLDKASQAEFEKYRDLNATLYTAKLEDAAESKDPVESAVARYAIEAKRDATGKEVRQRRQDVEEIVRKKLTEIAPTVASVAEGAGLIPPKEDAAIVEREINLLATEMIENPLSAGEKLAGKLEGRIRGERLRAYRKTAKNLVDAIEGLEPKEVTRYQQAIDNDYSFDHITELLGDAAKAAKESKERVARLQKAEREKGKRLVFSRDLGVVKPKNVTAKGLPKYLKESNSRWNLLATAKDTGVATDVRMAFKLFGKDKEAVDNAEPYDEGRALPLETINAAMAQDKKKSYTAATVVGARAASNDKEASDTYLLETESGSRLSVDAKLLHIIRSRYPDATMEIADKKPYDDKVYFRQDGEIVAVLMPFSEKNPVLEAEDDDAPMQGEMSMMGTPAQRNLNLTTPHSGTQISAADIIKTWTRIFDVPITATRMKAKQLGRYFMGPEVVDLNEKNAFDIVIASHEIAHHVDKLLGATSKMLDDLKTSDPARHAKVLKQLKDLDYAPKRRWRVEGFAELVRHYLTGDQSVAPEAMTWLTKDVIPADKKLAKAFAAALGHANQHATQGFMLRARAMIGRPPADLDKSEVLKHELMRAVDLAYQDAVDKNWMVKKASDVLEDRGGFAPGEATTYELVMAFDGTASAYAARSLHEGIETIGHNQRIISEPLTKALELLKTEDDYNDAQAYAISLHLLHTPPQYSGPWSRDEAQKIVDWVHSDPDRKARYSEFAQRLTDFNNKLLDFLEDAGLLSAESKKRMLDAHKDTYVPMHRIVEDGPHRPGRGGRVAIPAPIMGRSKQGSGRPVSDIIESTVDRTLRFVRLAMHYQIMDSLVHAADPQLGGVEGMGHLIRRMQKRVKPTTAQIDAVLNDLVKEGWVDKDDVRAARLAAEVRKGMPLSKSQLTFLGARYGIAKPTQPDVEPFLLGEKDVEALLTIWQPNYQLPSGKWAVRHRIGDETIIYELDPDFYQGIVGFDRRTAGAFFEIMRQINSPFKTGAIALSTGFGVTNITADLPSTFVNSKELKGIRRLTSPIRNAAVYVKAVSTGNGNELVSAFRRFGGEQYSAMGSDADAIRLFRQRAMKLGIWHRLKLAPNARAFATEMSHAVEAYLDRVRYLTAWSDVGPRIAEAEGYLNRQGYFVKKGKFVDSSGAPASVPRDTMIKAMLAGADVTYNYRRTGRAVQGYIEPVFPLTNAATQSLDKMARTIKAILGDQRKGGTKQEQARRLATALAIYVAVDLALKMASDSEDEKEQDWYLRFRHYTVGDGAKTVWKMIRSREYSIFANLISSYVTDGTEGLKDAAQYELTDRIPSGGGGVKAAAEVWANWDGHRGRALESPTLPQSPQLRFHKRTLETSKLLSATLKDVPLLKELSPIEIEHLLGGYSGGAYQRWIGFGERATKSVLRRKNEMTVRDIPFVRGLYVGYEQQASVNLFYEHKKKHHDVAEYAKYSGDNEAYRDSRYEYESALIRENLMSALRKHETEQYSPTTNIVALAREVLGKPALDAYPHPLYAETTPEARTALVKAIENEVRQVAVNADRPSDPEEEIKWQIGRDAAKRFIEDHSDSPLVQEAIQSVVRSDAFRDTLRGVGIPKKLGKTYPTREALQAGRKRFFEKRASAKEFKDTLAN